MAIAIGRTAWVDDDGTGTTGTILNNAIKTGLYDEIDAVLNATRAQHLLFTDATYDIGASGATRPRDLFLSRNAVIGGSVDVATNVKTNTYFNLNGSRGNGGGLAFHSVIAGTGSDLSPSFYAETNYSLYFMSHGSATIKAKLDTVGDWFTNDGTVSSLSDGRLKTVVRPFSAGLKELLAIQPSIGVYRYRTDVPDVKAPMSESEFVSAIAQEVQPYIPEAIKVDDQGWYTMKAQPFIYALINAVSELEGRVAIMEGTVVR